MPTIKDDDHEAQAVLASVDRLLNQLGNAPLGDTAAHHSFIRQIKDELAKLTTDPEPDEVPNKSAGFQLTAEAPPAAPAKT